MKIFEQNSNRTALIFEGRSISYAEVGTQVAKVMYALKMQDLATGSVVAICLRKVLSIFIQLWHVRSLASFGYL